MNPPAPWHVPGLAGQPEWLAALLLTVLWAANAHLTAWAADRRSLWLVAAIELLLLVWLETHLAWRTDSGVVWLWGNLVSSVLVPGGLVVALRVRLDATVRVTVVRFWRMAWPLLGLAVVGNAMVAVVRVLVLRPLLQ